MERQERGKGKDRDGTANEDEVEGKRKDRTGYES